MKMFACLFLSAFAAVAVAADEPQLSIEHPVLHQSEDGPEVPSDFGFQPGDPVYFSCLLGNYKKLEKDEKEKIFLTYVIEARDSKGVLLVAPENGEVAADITPEDRKWMPKVRFSMAVPAFAESGEYHLSIQAKDQISGKKARAETVLRVEGRNVPPSDTLVVRNFRFLRSEEDRNPLEVAAYRPGDTLWARFDMTGYKLGELNAFDVSYGLTVLRPNGEPSYSQPEAAEEKNQSFYPQRYTPGILSLNIPKDMALGGYTIVLTVQDRLGNQTYETKQKFSVE